MRLIDEIMRSRPFLFKHCSKVFHMVYLTCQITGKAKAPVPNELRDLGNKKIFLFLLKLY